MMQMFMNINVPKTVSQSMGLQTPQFTIFKLHGRLASINRDQQ